MGARHATQRPTPTSGPGCPRGPAPLRPRAQRCWWAHPALSYLRRTCWTEGWSSTCCLWGAWGQPTVAGPCSHPHWSRYPLTLEQGLPRPCQSQREPWPGGCGWKRGPSGSKASPKVPSGAPSTACPHQRLAAVGPHQRRVPAIPPSACLPGRVPWGPSRLAPPTTQTTSQCRPGLSNRRGGEPWVRLGLKVSGLEMRPCMVAMETVGWPEASGTGAGAVLGWPMFQGTTSGAAVQGDKPLGE